MNNFSKEHSLYLKKIKRDNLYVRLMRWGVLILFLALWELLAQTKVIDAFITSCPSRIATTFVELIKTGNLLKHTGITLLETVVAFVLATGLGAIIAILLWWFERTRKILEPYLVVLNALPKIALGPMIIIWVGAGQGAIITMALMISLIITIISILNGFMSVEQSKILLMKTLHANKYQVLTKLILPANIPTIIAALKINVGMCWVGTIMGEYLVSRAGLGYLIIYGGQIFKLDLVMTSTFVLCILAWLMYMSVELLEKLVKKKFARN